MKLKDSTKHNILVLRASGVKREKCKFCNNKKSYYEDDYGSLKSNSCPYCYYGYITKNLSKEEHIAALREYADFLEKEMKDH